MPKEQRRLVVIGNGMVGHRLVEALLARDTSAAWQITVLAEEPHPAYDRIALSSLFAGNTPEDLRLPVPPEDERLDVVLGDSVVPLDREARSVTTASGAIHVYDHLVLATGSSPCVPPIPGADRDGCSVYRTLDDVA